MRTETRLGLALALLVLTVGCIGGGDDVESTSADDETANASDETDTEAETGAQNVTGEVAWTNQTGHWTAGGHADGNYVHALGSAIEAVSLADNATGAAVVLSWEPSTPLSETLTIEVNDADGEQLAVASGSSPAFVEADASTLAGTGELSFAVYPGDETAGAWVDQAYDVDTAVFVDRPFEPGLADPEG
jgi:hypothetical protein